MFDIVLQRVGDSVLLQVLEPPGPGGGRVRYTLMLEKDSALLLARQLVATATVAQDSLDRILEELS